MTPTNIRYANAFALKVPLIKPMLMAGTRITHAETLIVRIEANNGVIGWGETTAAPSHGGQSLEEMHRMFAVDLREKLIGKDILKLSGITQELGLRYPKASGAIAAIDIALYDALGKHLHIPAYTLMGGKKRDEIAPLYLVGTNTVESDIADAKKYFSQGYRFFKLKLAVKTPEEDIQSALGIRAAIGPEAKICADANTGYSTEVAVAFLQKTQDAHIEFLEQPLAKDNLDGLEKICSLKIAPIGLDESITSVQDIIKYTRYGISGVSLKTLKLGGITGVLRSANICEAFNLEINLAGKIAETSIASAAVLHLSAALNHVSWGVSPSHLYLSEDVVTAPPQPINGMYTISNGPGLGVDVDEAQLKRFHIPG